MWYNILKIIFFLMIVCITTPRCSERDGFPDINDIFKSLSENLKDIEAQTEPPDAVFRRINIDLETVNMSKFREKIKGYGKAFNTNTSDEVNPLVKEFKSRRLAWKGSWRHWKWASRVLVQTKIYDLMLQTIYMARHKIKQIEKDPYYNPTDTTYRIAFLYRNLARINRKMQELFTMMKKNLRNLTWPLTRFLVLHHKAAKLHVDFLYLWWVMVRMNERYHYRHGIPNTPPQPGQYVYTRPTPRRMTRRRRTTRKTPRWWKGR